MAGVDRGDAHPAAGEDRVVVWTRSRGLETWTRSLICFRTILICLPPAKRINISLVYTHESVSKWLGPAVVIDRSKVQFLAAAFIFHIYLQHDL